MRPHITAPVIGFLVLLAALIFVRQEDINRANEANEAIVQSTVVTGVANCNRDFRGRIEVLSVLRGSREFARAQYENGEISEETFNVGDKFYAERLEGLPLPDCRKIERTITANANRIDKIKETPLYPGAPGVDGDGALDPGKRPQPGGGGG